MKQKAESEARESLQSASGASNRDSVSSATIPDDAKELIAAMRQNESSTTEIRSQESHQASKTDPQKSRARRLTSTTLALHDVPQPQCAKQRESSGKDLSNYC